MRKPRADHGVPGAQRPVEAVRQMLLTQVSIATRLRSQMQQAHFCVRGAGRLVTDGVFARIAGRIDAIVALLVERIALRGVAAAQSPDSVAAAPMLPSYPLGVADEHAHAFAASCALAIVAQAARVDAGAALALGDPATERLLNQIARRIDAEIWVVQQSLNPPVDTAPSAMYRSHHAKARDDSTAL